MNQRVTEGEAQIDEIAALALRGASEPRPATLLPRHGRQNLLILALQVIGWAGALSLLEYALHADLAQGSEGLLGLSLALSRALSLACVGLTLCLFCALMQGVFSLMHEYFHSLAHRSARVNALIGLGASALFITSPTLHKVNHWSHHIRNRTPAEMGEFYFPHERRSTKTLLYYFAILGGLYLSGIVVPLLALFVPYRVADHLVKHGRRNTYAAAFGHFTAKTWTRMRWEALLMITLWSAIGAWGPWSAETLLCAYATFALTWSSLQWVYHLRTPIDVVEGAYNLRLPTPLRLMILNFNCNLTHHRRPHLPWQALYRATDPRETQPLWYRWALAFKPPEPLPQDHERALEKRYF